MKKIRPVLWTVGALVVVACGAGRSPETRCAERYRKVSFSVSNQLTRYPAAMVDVYLDGESVFHGPVVATGSGKYLYLQTWHARSLAEIRVVYETPEGSYRKKKVVGIQDRTWIVVALAEFVGGGVELDIEVTYEQPLIEIDPD